MSFVLPGNARELRFTGEVKALDPKTEARTDSPPSGTELGKPRLRKPPASVRRIDTPTQVREEPPPSVAAVSVAPQSEGSAPPRLPPKRSPYLPPVMIASANALEDWRTASPLEIPSPARLTDPDPSIDEHALTTAMVRDALDVLPGGGFQAKPAQTRPAPIPIPHFRPRQSAIPTQLVPARRRKVRAVSGLPLGVWVAAAIVAAIVSFRVAPEIVTRLEPPTAQR